MTDDSGWWAMEQEMTPQERLKEIEAWYCNRSDEQVKWLIARVKQLEDVLKAIHENEICKMSECSCRGAARKALESDE